MTNFKDFKVGNLFTIKPTKSYGMTNSELLKHPGNTPLITNSSKDNGVYAYLGLPPTEKAGILTFSDTGMSATESIFYQPKDFIGYSHVQGMYPKFAKEKLTENVGIYIATALRKAVKGKYDFYVKFTRENVEDTFISLPSDINGEPNWDFMENYIRNMQNFFSKRIYDYIEQLGFSSLEDTKLTKEDLLTLEKHTNATMKVFQIGDLFQKESAKFLGNGDKFKAVSKTKDDDYKIPMLYAKSGNNGVMYWSKDGDFETHSNVLGIIYNGAIAAGLVYPHKDSVGILAESYLISYKASNAPFEVNLYFSKVIEKVIYPKYSREYLATWEKVRKDYIKLPVNSKGNPDLELIKKYIKVIQKKVLSNLIPQ